MRKWLSMSITSGAICFCVMCIRHLLASVFGQDAVQKGVHFWSTHFRREGVTFCTLLFVWQLSGEVGGGEDFEARLFGRAHIVGGHLEIFVAKVLHRVDL